MSAILLVPLLAAASAGPDFGGLEIYKDWAVGCDNRRECQAVSLPVEADGTLEPAGDGDLAITIRRNGAPVAPPVVSFSILEGAGRDASDVRSITVDGKPVDIPFSHTTKEPELTGDAAQRLISAMRDAEVLGLAAGDGKTIASASLRGLKASLLYMDEQQLRTGTTSALAKPGTKPANAFTILPMLPRLVVTTSAESPEPPTMLTGDKIDALLETDPCRNHAAPDANKPAAEYARLDGRTTLMLLNSYCGGYNADVRIFVIDNRGNVRPAPFGPHPWSGDADHSGTSLANGWWNPRTRILGGFGKARGLGDCGEILEFVWDESGQFRLVRYASMSECRGSYDYITTYRLDVRIIPVLEVPTVPRSQVPPAPRY